MYVFYVRSTLPDLYTCDVAVFGGVAAWGQCLEREGDRLTPVP